MRSKRLALLWLASVFSLCFAALNATDSPPNLAEHDRLAAIKSDNPLTIDITAISRQYLNRKNMHSTQITLRTDAAALFELRRGMNCSTSHALAEGRYHGLTKNGQDTVAIVEAADLKDGINHLVFCFNREKLLSSSSRNLDYRLKVYEKGLFLIVDNVSPDVSAYVTTDPSGSKRVTIACSDSFGCHRIYYAFEKENPRDGTVIEDQATSFVLQNAELLSEKITFRAQDRAGNFSETKILALREGIPSPYGHGRFTLTPAYLLRLDQRRDKTPGGLAVFLAGDFGIHNLLHRGHHSWLPGLRVEAGLATLQAGENTTDVTGLWCGPVWLFPLSDSKKVHLLLGTTLGITKSFAIYSDNTTASATAFAANAFAGLEYSVRGLVFQVQMRIFHMMGNIETVLAAGAGFGVGLRF